jgi:hypothetical protein
VGAVLGAGADAGVGAGDVVGAGVSDIDGQVAATTTTATATIVTAATSTTGKASSMGRSRGRGRSSRGKGAATRVISRQIGVAGSTEPEAASDGNDGNDATAPPYPNPNTDNNNSNSNTNTQTTTSADATEATDGWSTRNGAGSVTMLPPPTPGNSACALPFATDYSSSSEYSAGAGQGDLGSVFFRLGTHRQSYLEELRRHRTVQLEQVGSPNPNVIPNPNTLP